MEKGRGEKSLIKYYQYHTITIIFTNAFHQIEFQFQISNIQEKTTMFITRFIKFHYKHDD